MSDDVRFSTMDENGNVFKTRILPQSSIQACPHYILVPEHYRDDNSCRCDDPSHVEMEEWGYQWDGKVWS